VKVFLFGYTWLVFCLYALSFWGYLLYFRKSDTGIASLSRKMLLTGILSHLIYLILLFIQHGHLPVGNLYQVLTFVAWLSAVVYMILELRLQERTMGVFFIPVVMVLHAISSILMDVEQPLAPVLTDIVFEFHVAAVISSYAAFAISFIASLMFILLSREMKSRRLGIFFQRLPSLDFFDKLSNQAVNIGLVLITVGIVIGFYLGMNVWEGRWVADPKLVAAVVSWAIYLVHYISRKSAGWQGRRAAILSVVGFNWLLFSFIIVNIFFSKIHSFI
jgi:cytochrome c-type biogenesis protein CcsB